MKIYSIFSSANGEVNSLGIGSLCTFIRFAGCSAGCVYCDTKYAKNPSSGKEMSVGDILRELNNHPSKNITITGGEPFEQEESLKMLLSALSRFNYNVTVETNGLHDFDAMDFYGTNWVVDIKSISLIPRERYISMNLRTTDYLKIIISNHAHFSDMLIMKKWLQFGGVVARFAFSPEHEVVAPNELMKWMLESKEGDLYLNFQAHKVLNLSEPD